MKTYTMEQYDLDIELERYVAMPVKPRFEATSKLAGHFLKVKGLNSNDLLQWMTAVKSLEQLWADGQL